MSDAIRKIVFDRTIGANTTLCDYSMTVSRNAITVIEKDLSKWRNLMPREKETWIARTHSVPSLLVRVDAIVVGDMVPVILEVEDRPCGEYLVSCANRQFSELLGIFRERFWPPFKGVVALNRPGDISQWLETLTIEEAAESNELLWLCCRPDDETFHRFTSRAVAPLRFEGMKDYLPGLRLGRSKIITAEDLNSVDWTRQWVFKPCCGTRCLDVLVYWAGLPQRPDDTAGKERVQRKIRESGGAAWIMQEYRYAPSLPRMVQNIIQSEKGTKRSYWYIMRLYFAFHPSKKKYVPLGGAWNAREDRYALLHGTPDAVFGSVYLPDDLAKQAIS